MNSIKQEAVSRLDHRGKQGNLLPTPNSVFASQMFTGQCDELSVGGSTFTRCLFDRFVATNGCFGGGPDHTVFQDCVFRNCKFNVSIGGQVSFHDCAFEDSQLRNTRFVYADFTGCRFAGGKLLNVVFNGTSLPTDTPPLRNNAFYGNDFSATLLDGVGFRRGVDLDKQILPSGAGYVYWPDVGVAVEKARCEMLNLPEGSRLRKEVRITLEIAMEDLADGQTQCLFYLPTLVPSKALADELFEFFHRVTVAE